jgi:alpha-D-ribose 1-methylphosphonate 5-triphosphate synthase subunit PhnI
MAARDGIGAPRRPSTIERERLVLEEARRLAQIERRGLRYEDAERVLEGDITRKQINYTLERLARAGQLVRRDGYNWHPLEM